jgi:hypothetical protein
MNLNKIQAVKHINHVICKWDIYKPRTNNITQCFKCSRFGHGAASCHMSKRCIFCAGKHPDGEVCPVKDTPTKHVCANCKKDHPAVSSACEARGLYLNEKRKFDKHIKSPPQYHYEAGSFPALGSLQPKPTYSPRITYAQQTSGFSNSNDLFSTNELFSIFSEIINKIKACTSKHEQIQALAEIAFKYVGSK